MSSGTQNRVLNRITDEVEGQVQVSHVRRSKTRQFKNPTSGERGLHGELPVENNTDGVKDRFDREHRRLASQRELNVPVHGPGLVCLPGLGDGDHQLVGRWRQVLHQEEGLVGCDGGLGEVLPVLH